MNTAIIVLLIVVLFISAHITWIDYKAGEFGARKEEKEIRKGSGEGTDYVTHYPTEQKFYSFPYGGKVKRFSQGKYHTQWVDRGGAFVGGGSIVTVYLKEGAMERDRYRMKEENNA